jgi:hypothetical protein
MHQRQQNTHSTGGIHPPIENILDPAERPVLNPDPITLPEDWYSDTERSARAHECTTSWRRKPGKHIGHPRCPIQPAV